MDGGQIRQRDDPDRALARLLQQEEKQARDDRAMAERLAQEGSSSPVQGGGVGRGGNRQARRRRWMHAKATLYVKGEVVRLLCWTAQKKGAVPGRLPKKER